MRPWDLNSIAEFIHHQKATQAWSFDEDQKVITLWEDGIARIFDPNEDDTQDQLVSQFIGHK